MDLWQVHLLEFDHSITVERRA